MPSVDQLKSGRWRVRWRDSAGNRHSPPGMTFATRAMARTYGLDREAEQRAGTSRDPKAGRMLLSVFADQWMASYVAAPRTVTKVQTHLDLYLKSSVDGADPLGDERLEQVTHMMVQAWVKRLENLGRSPASIAGYHRTLCTILNAAVKAGRVRTNVAEGVTLPTIPPPSDFYWTREEMAAVSFTRPLDAAVFALLLGTGVRWGEMAGLHSPRWVPLRRQMSVVDVIEEEKGMRLKAYPKGGRRRDLPVDAQVVEAVAAWLSESKPIDCGLSHGKSKCPGLIFHEDGRPLSRHLWPRDVLTPALVAAKARPGSPHGLRHTYASWLALDGVPLRTIQYLLGHASARTSERYQHLAPSEMDSPILLASLARRDPSVTHLTAERGPQVTHMGH